MKQAFTYSLKIWITTDLASPVIYWFAETKIISPLKTTYDGAMGFMGLSIFYGFLLSLPSFLLLLLSCFFVNRYTLTALQKKMVISVIGAVLILSPFYLIFGADDLSPDFLIGTYAIITFAGIWLYKLKPLGDEPSKSSKG